MEKNSAAPGLPSVTFLFQLCSCACANECFAWHRWQNVNQNQYAYLNSLMFLSRHCPWPRYLGKGTENDAGE